MQEAQLEGRNWVATKHLSYLAIHHESDCPIGRAEWAAVRATMEETLRYKRLHSSRCLLCGLPSNIYSPNCPDLALEHGPTMPDEKGPIWTMQYKTARLERMKDYLEFKYGRQDDPEQKESEKPRSWFDTIVDRADFKFSHTWQNYLPVLATRATTPGKVASVDSFVRCPTCSQMVPSEALESHEAGHQNSRDTRLMLILQGKLQV